MAQLFNFEDSRVLKRISIPQFKIICPGEKCYYSDGTYYIIYKNSGNAYPNVGRIDGESCKLFHKLMIVCYIAKRDTLAILESILFPSIENRWSFAQLIEELSQLHDTENKRIEEVLIEYDKIESIFEKYKNILKPVSKLYKFCYYWSSLCIALDYRVVDNKPTVIRRSLIVKDAIAYVRQQIKREDFGKSWGNVIDKVGPTKWITDIKYYPVKGHEKRLTDDRFINKKGEKISVEPYGRLRIYTS